MLRSISAVILSFSCKDYFAWTSSKLNLNAAVSTDADIFK